MIIFQAEHQLGEGCSFRYASFTPLKLGVVEEEGYEFVAKKKTKGPTWSEVKAVLIDLDQKQLLKLVGDL